MSLQIRKSSKWWYAQFVQSGNRDTIRLDVRVRGKRPASINEDGDRDFEESRLLAQAEHDRLLARIESERHAFQAEQAVVRLKTGRRVKFPKVADLVKLWDGIPRRRDLNHRYADQARTKLRSFVEFMAAQYPQVEDLIGITQEMAVQFMTIEKDRGISGKQYNETLKLLRSAYRHAHQRLGIIANPFYVIPYREVETIHRRPFNPEELARVLLEVRADPFMAPLVICSMCTAMRLGDCCMLQWKDVDLEEDYIRVKTHKTGETVEIPIFPPLREVLAKLRQSEQYVFPEQAEMYRRNPAGISYRFRKLLISAGFDKAPGADRREDSEQRLPTLPEDELRLKVYAYIDDMAAPANQPKKPEKMRRVFDLYLEGKTIPAISDSAGVSRGTASNYLNQLEDGVGAAVVHRRPVGARSVEGSIRAKRVHGRRRASVMDFHSLRVTWVTLALTRGIPMELVRVVTGHRTVEIVYKHYFKPRRDELRAAIEKHMPSLLTAPTKETAVKPDIHAVLAKASKENAWETLQELKAMVGRE